MKEKSLEKFNMKLNKDEIEYINYLVNQLSENSSLLEMDEYKQHKGTSRLWHCIAVSYFSFALCKFLRLRFNHESLVVGALLHDYYLYDWRDTDAKPKEHCRNHPEAALINANEFMELTSIEKDIISNHMYPMTSERPNYREGKIVCIVDKLCAAYEVCSKSAYKKMRSRITCEGRV